MEAGSLEQGARSKTLVKPDLVSVDEDSGVSVLRFLEGSRPTKCSPRKEERMNRMTELVQTRSTSGLE